MLSSGGKEARDEKVKDIMKDLQVCLFLFFCFSVFCSSVRSCTFLCRWARSGGCHLHSTPPTLTLFHPSSPSSSSFPSRPYQQDRLPVNDFDMETLYLSAMGSDKGDDPFTVVVLQECDRMNALIGEIRSSLKVSTARWRAVCCVLAAICGGEAGHAGGGRSVLFQDGLLWASSHTPSPLFLPRPVAGPGPGSAW